MCEPTSSRIFPGEDSLCERCGYPLKGSSGELTCPECGLAFEKSSPERRKGPLFQRSVGIGEWFVTTFQFLFFAEISYRFMRIDGSNRSSKIYLFLNLLLGSLLSLFTAWRDWIPVESNLVFFCVIFLALLALTYIEVLGVVAFSNRRGWRVPSHLSERVCCYASVGWLVGIFISGVGAWFVTGFGLGQPWFESYLGLVKVAWLFYAGLFVLSLLWFETLVWIGVRQVRFANRWPEEAPGTSGGAPDK